MRLAGRAALAVASAAIVASAGAATAPVRARVTPTAALAGERLAISARVATSAKRCAVRITRPGASATTLPERRPARRSVTWQWAVPTAARSGAGTARVHCPGTGSDTARFAIRALPPGDVERGKTVFLLTCGGCHTLRDAGTQGTSVDLDEKASTYERVVDRVINGKGLMPTFRSQLSAQQIADVALYVSTAAGR